MPAMKWHSAIPASSFDPSVTILASRDTYAWNRCIELGLSVEEK